MAASAETFVWWLVFFVVPLVCQCDKPPLESTQRARDTVPNYGCPDGTKCNSLGASCINCTFKDDCVYGQDVDVWCKALEGVNCTVNVIRTN